MRFADFRKAVKPAIQRFAVPDAEPPRESILGCLPVESNAV
jgi:hypothetical protein